MTSLSAPWTRTPLSGRANSSSPDRTRSRPPQKGRLRRQSCHCFMRARRYRGADSAAAGPERAAGTPPASSAVIASAAPAKAEAEVGQGERPCRRVPGVLYQVVDGDLRGRLAEGARRAAERARVLADADVVEDRRACRLVTGVDDEVGRAHRGALAARGEVHGHAEDR